MHGQKFMGNAIITVAKFSNSAITVANRQYR